MPCAVPMCAAVYDPICASNGKTYNNECVMSGDSCVDGVQIDLFKVHDGECYSRKFSLMPCHNDLAIQDVSEKMQPTLFEILQKIIRFESI